MLRKFLAVAPVLVLSWVLAPAVAADPVLPPAPIVLPSVEPGDILPTDLLPTPAPPDPVDPDPTESLPTEPTEPLPTTTEPTEPAEPSPTIPPITTTTTVPTTTVQSDPEATLEGPLPTSSPRPGFGDGVDHVVAGERSTRRRPSSQGSGAEPATAVAIAQPPPLTTASTPSGDLRADATVQPDLSLVSLSSTPGPIIAVLVVLGLAVLLTWGRRRPDVAGGTLVPTGLALAPPLVSAPLAASPPVLQPGQDEPPVVNPVAGRCASSSCSLSHTVTAEGRCSKCAPPYQRLQDPPTINIRTGHCDGCPFYCSTK